MVVGQAGERLDQHQVVLVGVGDRRVEDRGRVRWLGWAGGDGLGADGNGHHPARIHAQPLDHLATHVVADGHHQVGPANRPGQRPSQVAALEEREVPGVVERLEVVDGDGHRPSSTCRDPTAEVVDGHAGGPAGQPGGLGEDPAGAAATVPGVDLHVEGPTQVRVGVQRRLGQVDDRPEV